MRCIGGAGEEGEGMPSVASFQSEINVALRDVRVCRPWTSSIGPLTGPRDSASCHSWIGSTSGLADITDASLGLPAGSLLLEEQDQRLLEFRRLESIRAA